MDIEQEKGGAGRTEWQGGNKRREKNQRAGACGTGKVARDGGVSRERSDVKKEGALGGGQTEVIWGKKMSDTEVGWGAKEGKPKNRRKKGEAAINKRRCARQ